MSPTEPQNLSDIGWTARSDNPRGDDDVTEHDHLRGCASRNIDDLFRGECDCLADDPCGDGDCDICYPEYDESAPDPQPGEPT